MSNLQNYTSRRRFIQLSSYSAASCALLPLLGDDKKNNSFITEFGICTSHKNFKWLNDIGYGYVEDNTRRLFMPDKPFDAVKSNLESIKEKNIRVHATNSFLPGSLRCTGKETNHDEILKYAEEAFKRAKMIGTKGIVFGSSGSRKLKDGFDRTKAEEQFVSLLKRMAPIAQTHGIEIWLEPLNIREDNFINTQIQGATIVEKVGHPSLGLVFDLYHAAVNEEPAEDIAKCVKHMRHCHIAEKKGRTAPGTGDFDFQPYFQALKNGGYHGAMSIEGRWSNMLEQAKPAFEFLSNEIKK